MFTVELVRRYAASGQPVSGDALDHSDRRPGADLCVTAWVQAAPPFVDDQMAQTTASCCGRALR
ncbi:MAG: hypothetical protein ACLUFT_09895 [Gemmiger formicilis]